MKKKLTKNEKGITLVALIITIIVLLILAVVSIRAITGDNILGKSETAKEKYESAKSNELDILKNYENNIGPEKVNIEKIMNKAYIHEAEEGDMFVYSIIKDTEGYKINIKAIEIETGKDASEKYEGGGVYKITDISSSFDPITVYLDEIKEEINSSKYIKLTFTYGEICLSENYLLFDVKNNKEYRNGYMVRDVNYDKYVK